MHTVSNHIPFDIFLEDRLVQDYLLNNKDDTRSIRSGPIIEINNTDKS